MAHRPFNPQGNARSEYIVRFGDWRTIVLHIPVYIVGSLAGCLGVLALVMPPEGGGGPWSLLLYWLLALWGGYAVWKLTSLLWRVLSRKVAFRADSDGITLGCPLLQVPWDAIENIVLSRDTYSFAVPPGSGSAHSYYVHLDLRPDAEQIDSRREMEGWRLDTDMAGLAKALAAHAPHVGVVKRY